MIGTGDLMILRSFPPTVLVFSVAARLIDITPQDKNDFKACEVYHKRLTIRASQY